MAEYIRRLVDQELAHAPTQADLTSIIGLFGSGGSDISKEKDDAVRAAISERPERQWI